MSNTSLAIIGASTVWIVAIGMIVAMTKLDPDIGKVYTVYAAIIAIAESFVLFSLACGG